MNHALARADRGPACDSEPEATADERMGDLAEQMLLYRKRWSTGYTPSGPSLLKLLISVVLLPLSVAVANSGSVFAIAA